MATDDIKQYKYIYVTEAKYGGGYDVKGVGTYEKSSVLAGQDKIVFIETFETIEEAQHAYPTADYMGNFCEPRNTFDHLPDNGDGW